MTIVHLLVWTQVSCMLGIFGLLSLASLISIQSLWATIPLCILYAGWCAYAYSLIAVDLEDYARKRRYHNEQRG